MGKQKDVVLLAMIGLFVVVFFLPALNMMVVRISVSAVNLVEVNSYFQRAPVAPYLMNTGDMPHYVGDFFLTIRVMDSKNQTTFYKAYNITRGNYNFIFNYQAQKGDKAVVNIEELKYHKVIPLE